MPDEHSEAHLSGEIHKQPDVATLFAEKKDGKLLSLQGNPDAQLAAFVILQNWNITNSEVQQDIRRLNPRFIQEKLGLPGQVGKDFVSGVDYLISDRKIRDVYQKQTEQAVRSGHCWEGHSKYKEYQEQARSLYTKKRRVETKIEINAHNTFFPLREAILLNPQIPDQYKLLVLKTLGQPTQREIKDLSEEDVEWKSHALDLDKEEDELLKKVLSSDELSADVKKAALECAIGRIHFDVHALDVASLEEYEKLGADLDHLFLSVAGNKNIDRQFFEQEVAARFFPGYSPELAGKCWEILKRCTDGTTNKSGMTFYTEGLNFNTVSFNRDRFKEFMDHADKLIPYVDMMANYGFLYYPVKYQGLNLVYNPEFIKGIENLPQSPQELKVELDKIKLLYPYFKYECTTECIAIRAERRGEDMLETNPYAICFKQGILGRSNDKPYNKYKQLLLDPNVSELTRRCIATGYFEKSLDPDSQNVEGLYHYLQKYPEHIGISVDGEWKNDPDSMWYEFVMKSSDVYRYRLGKEDEKDLIALMRSDLDYAQRGLANIQNPNLRDKVAEQLVYALTDIDFRDLQTAHEIAARIENEYHRQQAEEIIALEIERERRGETSAWKKMERVRREAVVNKNYLADLLGFGTPEGRKQAEVEFYKRTGHLNVNSERLDSSPGSGEQLVKEIERIEGQVGLTVNLSWEAIPSLLETGNIYSMWDSDEVLRNRRDTVKYNYTERRDEIERKLGNRSKGGARDPHPVYGAVYSPNDRDEFFGAAPRYGFSYVKLKTENIKDRTTIVYDDSFNVFSDFPMTWDQATEVKAMLNVLKHQTAHKYVEAQVLNGISRSDIESINISKAELQFMYNGQEAARVRYVLGEIENLKRKYPEIKINIIKDADIDKYIELLPTFKSPVMPGEIEALRELSEKTKHIDVWETLRVAA